MHLFILWMIAIVSCQGQRGKIRHGIVKNTLGLTDEEREQINKLFYRVKNIEERNFIMNKDVKKQRKTLQLICMRIK